MKNFILNEGYKNSSHLFESGSGDKIYSNKKSFIDISNCAGSLLLGHNHKTYKKAISNYSKKNLSIFAHPNIHSVNFSKNIKKVFNWFDKIIFCNTGSEAITKSLRICRSLNKKKYIVNATGSWHGSVDQFLFYPDKNLKPNHLSSGLKSEDKNNLIYIPYNNLELTKKILNKNKKNINCIFLEPIQGGLPLEGVGSYLRFLRKFCNNNNIPLVFDEMITGIRSHNFSVQKHLKVYSDITTVGKVVGGGLPIGIIGISKKISIKINKKNRVFFGGTFSGNSLSSFVGNETLKYLIKNKNIINNINKKSVFFENQMNIFFEKNNLNLKVYRYASIIRIIYTDNKIQNRQQRDFFENKNIKKIKLFKKFLLEKKIFYASSGIIYFSHATSLKSINHIIKQMKIGSLKYLRR